MIVHRSLHSQKDYLRVYSTYCSNQQTSHDIMQKLLKKEKKFESFLQYTYARPECQGLDLGSFMIKPIQRICKYPLLMKELLKQTDAAHEEYQQTKDALQAIEDLVRVHLRVANNNSVITNQREEARRRICTESY